MTSVDGLLKRNLVLPERPLVPADRNRLLAHYPNLPPGSFAKVEKCIQPVFQAAGRAPILLIQPNETERFHQVSINFTGDFHALALARKLYSPHESRESAEQEIDAFISICGKVSEAFDEFQKPKSWLSRLSGSTAAVRQPILPRFNRTREQAASLAWRYGAFLKNLPRYQRSVEVVIAGSEAQPEELADWLEFAGFPTEPVATNTWYDSLTCVVLKLLPDRVSFMMPMVPRTPYPELVYDNMADAAKRFSLEFGGKLYSQEKADRIVRGWKSVLKQIEMSPGEEEVCEFFPFQIGATAAG